MTEEQIEKDTIDAMRQIVAFAFHSGGNDALVKVLGLMITVSVGIMRGLCDDDFVDGVLSAATQDKEYKIHIEVQEPN